MNLIREHIELGRLQASAVELAARIVDDNAAEQISEDRMVAEDVPLMTYYERFHAVGGGILALTPVVQTDRITPSEYVSLENYTHIGRDDIVIKLRATQGNDPQEASHRQFTDIQAMWGYKKQRHYNPIACYALEVADMTEPKFSKVKTLYMIERSLRTAQILKATRN